MEILKGHAGRKQKSFLNMLAKMPATLEFLDADIWDGMDKYYKFKHIKHGVFTAKPRILAHHHWSKGKSGHPADTFYSQGRPVICLETGITFPTITEAAKQMRLDKSTIAYCVLGRYKQAHGFTFKYADVPILPSGLK